jgi:hypothetical protein
MRYPAGELNDLLSATDLTEGVGDHLSVLGGDDLGQLTLALVQQLPKLEQDGSPFEQGRVEPTREGETAASIPVRVSSTDARRTCPVTTPLAGLVTGASRSGEPANGLPSIQWPTS